MKPEHAKLVIQSWGQWIDLTEEEEKLIREATPSEYIMLGSKLWHKRGPMRGVSPLKTNMFICIKEIQEMSPEERIKEQEILNNLGKLI